MRGELVSLDVLKYELANQLDSLVMQLYPLAQYDTGKRNWCLGSLAGEKGQSLRICRRPGRLGMWKDFSSGEGGDVLALVHAALNHADYTVTIKWVRGWLGLAQTISPEERRARERKAEEQRRQSEEQEARERQGRRNAALAHWLDGKPILGTPAERYLLGRHISFQALGRWPGALRFHPAMRCPVTKRDQPCLLAKLDGPDGEVMTVHRTFLMQHADGRVTKADKTSGGDLDDAKLAFGAYAGGWIPVWKGKSGKGLKLLAAGEWVAVTEGVEDALTVAMARPDLRVLSALSLSNIGGLQLPERVGGIYLCADNDVKPDAIEGFRRARARLEERGFAIREVRPPAQFKDFNEWAAHLARETGYRQEGVA
ncbi:MAG: DUF7146 domain-containing protein [Rhabdaerophilum sp.]